MIEATITSPEDPKYNCIAWAIHDNGNWWEPDPMNLNYWPSEVPRRYTIDSYVKAYESLGYEICSDSNIEANYEKVVLYKDKLGIPTHASRQITNDRWTSKLGPAFDVEHAFLSQWDDSFLKPDNILAPTSSYGSIAVILKKKIN